MQEAVRRDYLRGQNKLIEAVQFDDGTVVVEYLHKSKMSARVGHQYQYRCQVRLVVAMPDGRNRTGITITSWLEDKKGNRKRSHP